jgi:uncharacterized protein with PIN domain
MKFAVDCMLGKLAKWLKILGFDVCFFSKIEDDNLLEIASKEKRILLTRDTGLFERGSLEQRLFIISENWQDQIHQVLDELRLWDEVLPYSRCIECNIPLKSLPKKRAQNLVTPFVYEKAESFSLCPDCGRVYWKGTHHKDMGSKVDEILKKQRKGKIQKT